MEDCARGFYHIKRKTEPSSQADAPTPDYILIHHKQRQCSRNEDQIDMNGVDEHPLTIRFTNYYSIIGNMGYLRQAELNLV